MEVVLVGVKKLVVQDESIRVAVLSITAAGTGLTNSSRAKRCQEHGTSGNLLRVLVVLVWFSLGLVASSFFFSHML